MVKPTLYLVRRENVKFIGPMTANELRDGIRRMDFGIQDEVAGNCGAWVVLDQKNTLVRHYPELVDLIADELPVAWREAAGHDRSRAPKKSKQLSNQPPKTKKIQQKVSKKAESSMRNGVNKGAILIAWIVFLASMAGIVWLFTVRGHEEALPPLNDISALSQKPDVSEFLNTLGLKIAPVVSRVKMNKDPQGAWLAHLRTYAFYTTGSVDGLPLRFLRGNAPTSAPSDCSVESWKRRWKEGGSQIGDLNIGTKLVRNQWTKVLAWDPWWIRRRNVKGWTKPRSWFEGCLMSATVALRSVINEPNLGADSEPIPKELGAAIARRLQIQLEIIQLGRSSLTSDAQGTLAAFSCMDLSDGAAALDRCHLKVQDAALQAVVDDHYAWQLVRLAVQKTSGPMDAQWIQDIQKVILAITPEELMSRMDNGAELRFAQLVSQSAGNVDGILDRVNTEFPDVHLRP